MDKLSFNNSQAFSALPNFPSLLKTSPNPPSLAHKQIKHIIVSKLDFKSPNLNAIATTSSSHELPTIINPLHSQGPTTELPQHFNIQTKPHKEVKTWNPLQRIVAAALDMVERVFIEELEKNESLPDTVNPKVQLAGNFFPVPESAVEHELEVEGKLPEGLEGVYVRNGANPMYRPLRGHHLFDGDGMLHAVRIKQGIASYANRFTRTHRFIEEERVGKPIFPKAIGELHGHSGIARLLLFYARAFFGLINGKQGIGVANAGVVFFNGLLLAMSEDDLPYAVHITSSGDLQTLGKYDFSGQLNSSMIAHPKVDLETGELFALSYDVIKKPYVKYFKVNKDGEKGVDVSISGVNEPTMMHDFAITKNFVIIPDQQVIFKLQEMLRGGSPVLHDADKISRFGILPRDAVDDRAMKWIDVPDCFCFHLWNAWEEGDEVVVIGSCMTPPDSIFNQSKEALQSVLTEIRLDLKSLTSHRRVISPSLNLEAGQVNRKLLGKKTQFAYLAIAQPWPKVSGIAKVNLLANIHTISPTKPPNPLVREHTYPPSTPLAYNHTYPSSTLLAYNHTYPSCTLYTPPLAHTLTNPPTSNLPTIIPHTPLIDENITLSHPPPNGTHQHIPHHNKRNGANTNPNPINDNVVASFIYPPNCFGGEPMFVPRSLDPSTPEDDGYVLTFMHNEETCKSELLILDASSPTLQMLASIKIPSRVPYGFHGTFVTSQELLHQKFSL